MHLFLEKGTYPKCATNPVWSESWRVTQNLSNQEALVVLKRVGMASHGSKIPHNRKLDAKMEMHRAQDPDDMCRFQASEFFTADSQVA